MTVHKFPRKKPHIAQAHIQRSKALHGAACGGIQETDPTDAPLWLAAQLPKMAGSITAAFHKIASEPTIEACELAAAQLHHVVIHLTWISMGLAKQTKRKIET